MVFTHIRICRTVKQKRKTAMEEIRNAFYNADSPAKPAGEGVTRKILAHSENIMVCEMHFEKGAVGAPHSHPHEQVSYVISGKFEFTIGGKKIVVGPGDTTYKQPNVVHGAVCLEEGVMLDIFTPERKDFLS